LAGTADGFAVTSSWDGPTGSGNLLIDNCIWNDGRPAVAAQSGFSAKSNRTLRPQLRNVSSGLQQTRSSPCRVLAHADQPDRADLRERLRWGRRRRRESKLGGCSCGSQRRRTADLRIRPRRPARSLHPSRRCRHSRARCYRPLPPRRSADMR
jgi:hypothetical protein